MTIISQVIFHIIYLIYNDKLKNFTQRKYDLLTLCVVVLLIHVLGDYCFNRGLKFAPNPGYVTAFMSLTIVFVYLSSFSTISAQVTVLFLYKYN